MRKNMLIAFLLVTTLVSSGITLDKYFSGSAQASTPSGSNWTYIWGGNSFPDVAFKCHGVDGIYVSNFAGNIGTGGDISVVTNDPECGAK